MEFVRDQVPVRDIVQGWESGSLVRNPEYQRGEAWRLPQKQALIDSIFRQYPIPPIFLEEKRHEGLFGGASEKHEIIDGQQRILSLAGFVKGEFELLKSDDTKLRLPKSLRGREAPWGGRSFTQLDANLRDRLLSATIEVFVVKNVEHEDEVRDLFIRLQSGTALTRQQIRDAWPGTMGPIVEEFAGKLAKRPRYSIFRAVDGRGTRDEERDARDPYVTHRQTCAQLMRLLFARMSDPRHFPSVEASDVDAFYHEYTDTGRDSPALVEVEEIFAGTQKVTEYLSTKWSGKKKLPKLSLFALALFFQDMRKNAQMRLGATSVARLGEYAASVSLPVKSRSVSGPTIKSFYESWRNGLPDGIGVELDQKRLFDESDKQAILMRGTSCGRCGQEVPTEEAEFDHFPVPHSWGGRTVPENGRVVHKGCHPRGQPRSTDYQGANHL